MSFPMTRALMRKPLMGRLAIRNASSTSEAASAATSKAKETASQATSKASEGLTRVTSTAGSTVSKYTDAATSALGRIGGRTGKIISFAQSLVPPTIYYSKVGLELGKLIAHGQKMSPPNVSTFQSYLQPAMKAVRNPSGLVNQTTSAANSAASQPSSLLSSFRNFDSQQLATTAVVAAEVIGFFTVGEIIGRFKIIGYRSSAPAHGEH